MPTTPPPLPVSELLAANVLAALQSVTAVNAYAVTLLKVDRPTGAIGNRNPEDLSAVQFQYAVKPPQRSTKVPYGQAEWAAVFESRVYLRDGNPSQPIDQRVNVVIAEVSRALMTDPRRGGICHIDNVLMDPFVDDGIVEGEASGIWTVSVFLLCEYRTIRSDLRQLAPVTTNEAFFQGGAVLMLAAESNGVLGPWRRYADLHIKPVLDALVKQARDDRDGGSRAVTEQHVSFRHHYEIEGDYLNPEILALQFAGDTPTTYSQAATPLVNVAHQVAAVDSVLPLHDANQNPLFNLASVQSVTSADGTRVYVAGTDYVADLTALSEGSVRIPAGSTISPGLVLVSCTPTAAVGRPVFDVAMATKAQYRARIIWSAADGQQMVHGDFRSSLVVQSVTDDTTQARSTKFLLTALGDGSASPAGRMLLPAGAIPAAGF